MHISKPVQIFLGLTYKCNLSCAHCYVKKKKNSEMSLKKIKLLIKELSSIGIFKIIFSHGESLLRSDFYKILDYCAECDISTTLLSNGILISSDTAKKLKSSNLSKIIISLDSLDNNYHNSLRGRRDAFEKALSAIKELTEAGMAFGINVTINESSSLMLEKMVKFAIRSMATEINFLTLRPPGFEIKNSQKSFGLFEYAEAIKEIWRLKNKYKGKVNIGFHDPLIIKILNKKANKKQMMALKTENECQAGRLWASIQPSGDVQPCNFFPKKIGNINRTTFAEIWNQKGMRVNILSSDCLNCETKKWCKGGCKAYSYKKDNNYKSHDSRCPSIFLN